MLKHIRRWARILFSLIDLLFIAVSYVVVYGVLGGFAGGIVTRGIISTFIVTGFFYILLDIASGMYKSILRYVGVRDLATMGLVCIASFIGAACVGIVLGRSIVDEVAILVSGMLSFALILLFRVIMRIWYMHRKAKRSGSFVKNKNVLIIGAGEATARILDELHVSRRNYKVCALIDDDPARHGGSIRGVEVAGNRYDIGRLCKKFEIDEIFFCIPSIDVGEKAKILKLCTETGCKVRVLDSQQALGSRDTIYKNIKDVSIEDLLERDKIELDTTDVESYIKDKTVMVTGGGGSIGSELCRQIVKFSPEKIIIVDIYENNAYSLEQEMRYKHPEAKIEVIIASVRDKARLDSIFKSKQPDIVFHAAAHKHVPLMEHSPSEAVKNNVFGTYNCAMCAHENNVKRFVLISTDKAVNPTNVMGATKRICEMIIQSINEISDTEFVAVRFGNVLGSNGSVVPLFKTQIEAGGPITLTHKEITRFFMTIPEAAQLVLQAGALAKGGEIFVLDMGKPVKIYDLAVNLITLSGLIPGVDIPIKITGLRPGEKLYEELLMSEEGLSDTKHDKIYTARPMHFDWNELNEKLDRLKECFNCSEDEIRNEVKSIVPTFRDDDRNKACEGKGKNIEFAAAK